MDTYLKSFELQKAYSMRGHIIHSVEEVSLLAI